VLKVQAPGDGRYTVVLRDADASAGGSYELRFQRVPGSITMPKYDADGFGDWVTSGGIWQPGVPIVPGGPTPYSGTTALGTVLSAPYFNDATADLTSPVYLVGKATTLPKIQFWHWWSLAEGDAGRLQISVDGGVWTDLGAEFTGSNTSWSQLSIDLCPYAGKSVRFRFRFTSYGDETAPGWFLDDLTLVNVGPVFTAGFYSGLVRSSPFALASTGSATVTVSSGNAFSGKLKLGAASYSILGVFDRFGGAQLSIPRRNLSPLRVEDEARIAGVVTDGNITEGVATGGSFASAISADRLVWKTKANPAPQRGAYTIVFAPPPSPQAGVPTGDGYGLVTVKDTGAVSLVATLADGTRFSQGAWISQDGVCRCTRCFIRVQGCSTASCDSRMCSIRVIWTARSIGSARVRCRRWNSRP
jgi:hypothetical protein